MERLWQKRVHMGVVGLLSAAIFFMPWWTSGFEWATIAAALLTVVHALMEWDDKMPKLRWPSYAFLGFAIWAYISTMYAPEYFDSSYNFIYFVGFYILFYLLIVAHIRTPKECVLFLSAFMAGACVVAGVGFYQYFVIDAQGTAVQWTDAGRFPLLLRRMYSTLGNPNLLGAYLLMVCGMLASMTAVKEKGWKRVVGLALLFVFFIILALTYSRGAWIAAIAVLAIASLVYDRRLAWGLLIIPVFLLFYHGQVAERLLSVFDGTDTSVVLRFAFWDSTLQMIADHPIFGIGWGAYFLVYPHYDYFLQNSSVLIYHAHNMYLNIAAETGIPGLFLYLLAFWGHGWLAWRFYHRTERPLYRGLALGVLLCVLGMTVNGIFDYNFFNRTVSLSFWSLCALLVASVSEGKKEMSAPVAAVEVARSANEVSSSRRKKKRKKKKKAN